MSNIAIEILKTEQNTDTPLKLIQEVPTRWNSAYKMIQRILKTNDSLNRSLLKIKKAPAPLSINEITVLNDIEKLLKPFDETNLKVSGSSDLTISLIIPLTFGICNSLLSLKTSIQTEEGKIMCEKLIESVQLRLFLYEKRTVAQMGTLLDSAFKQEGFRSLDNAKAAGQFLEQMISILNKEENEDKDQKHDHDSKKNTNSDGGNCDRSSSLFAFMNERKSQKVKSKKVYAIIIKRQYCKRHNTSQNSDSLLFWKINRDEFHPLHQCAKKYLCIPATSVESESVFSITGQIATDRRSRLKPRNVDISTFANKNYWLVNK